MAPTYYDLTLELTVHKGRNPYIPGLKSIDEVRTYGLHNFPLQSSFIPEGETIDIARRKDGSTVNAYVEDARNGLGKQNPSLYVTMKTGNTKLVESLEKIIAKYQ
jgi:hypothetical protein